MKRLLTLLSLSVAVFGADNGLLYKVVDNGKSLGYYQINYNNNGKAIETKSYGMADKIDFFVDKDIIEKNAGTREITFQKNDTKEIFKIQTKMSLMDKATKEEFDRKLNKVEGDDMLLITKKGDESIELFNKRKTIIFTLEEVLEQTMKNKIDEDILLFDQLGVMKMIAAVQKTSKGFDIINKTKESKYIGIEMKNKFPYKVKSYVSEWSLELIGAGEMQGYEANMDSVNDKVKLDIENKIKDNSNISFGSIATLSLKGDKLFADATIKVNYGEKLSQSDGRSFCNKAYKEIFKKGSKIVYGEDNCMVQVQTILSAQDTINPLIAELTSKHEQLKFTKNYEVSKNVLVYKLMNEIK